MATVESKLIIAFQEEDSGGAQQMYDVWMYLCNEDKTYQPINTHTLTALFQLVIQYKFKYCKNLKNRDFGSSFYRFF